MLRENCSYWVKQPSTRLDLADLSIAFLWPFNFGWWIDLSHSYMMIKQIKRNAKVNAINPTREAPQNSSVCHLQRHSSDDVNKEGHSAAAHVATKIKSAGYITSHPSQWSGTMCSNNWWSQPIQKKQNLIENHWVYLEFSSCVQWTQQQIEARLTNHIPRNGNIM